MKRIQIIVCILTLTFLVKTGYSQGTIPNSSFEDWVPDSIESMMGGKVYFDRPDNWNPLLSLIFSIFSESPINLTKTTDHHGSGEYAAKIFIDNDEVGADLACIFPFSERPEYLKYYYKKNNSVDTVSVMVALTKYNHVKDTQDVVGIFDTFIIQSSSTFTELIADIDYMDTVDPDSAFIWITYFEGTTGGDFIIDNVSFGNYTGIANSDEGLKVNI